ncbi:MAG: MFS transporter [Desulfobulbaceae bacterium]|nr:MAG: MFS transporter [Desulfobulbaceae bacterium]
MKTTTEEKSWILYDVGNSAFVLVMVTAIMPIFFKDFAASHLPAATSTAYWGYANSSAALVLALLSPFLGVLADRQGVKKRFFSAFLIFGVLMNLFLVFVSAEQWLICLGLFILARIGWGGANLFYDAMLCDVTTPDRLDLISTRGYALGYIGSVIPFVIILALILTADHPGPGLPPLQIKIAFVIVAGWWFSLSIPALKNLRQRHADPNAQSSISYGLRKLLSTIRDIRKHRNITIFLIAYFFYIDGVGTIISMSTVYGRDLGFGATQLIIVLLFIQIVAFPFALLYGKLADTFSTRTMIFFGIFIYTIVTLLGFLLPSVTQMNLRLLLFWLIAFLVASSMGGIQALSRSYYSRIIPVENSAEFFGFYNIFGKFAAITGPFLMAIVTSFTGQSKWGILSIMVLFIAGAFILSRVKD